MALKSIEEEWKEFSAFVFRGKEISSRQRSEMKKAFFAGANVVSYMMQEIGDDSVPEDIGVAHIESIIEECDQFYKTMISQHAHRN